MVDKKSLIQDIEELKLRVSISGMLKRVRDGEDDLLTTAHSVPTLASVGMTDEAVAGMRALLLQRDEFGGWDEPATTIIALEALVALTLRKITVPHSDGAIDIAVKVLRDHRPLDQPEWELRLARAIVLSGLASQDAAVIDAGLLRARSLLEGSPAWNESLPERLHALLALTDLVTISKDPGTQDILTTMLKNIGMIGGDGSWMHEITSETAARAGNILEKLGHHDQAVAAYEFSSKLALHSSMSTTALKHRVELGVRLFGEPASNDLSQEKEPEEEASQTEVSNEVEETVATVSSDTKKENLPSDGFNGNGRVSAIVVQKHSDEEITKTLAALIRQSRQPEQIIVVWADSSQQVHLPEYAGEWVEVRHGSSRPLEGWKLGFSAATSQWVWPMRAGAEPEQNVLSTMVAATGEHDAVYVSRERGELELRLTDLIATPSLAPERCLLKRASVNIASHGQSFWEIAHLSLSSLDWAEKVESDGSIVKEAPQTLETLAALACELPRFHSRYHANSPEERQHRRKSLDKIRKALYSGYQEEQAPLVSLLVDGTASTEKLRSAVHAIIGNTSSIPFEVIAISGPDLNHSVSSAMEHMGVLVLESNAANPASAWNLAASQAKGLIWVFIDGSLEVESGWLEPLLHAMQEEQDAAIAGGLVQTSSMTVAHAGIAFHESAQPYRMHSTAPVVIPAIHRRRSFQALAGGLLLTDAGLFRKLGGLDESLNRDSALIDYCLKARQHGVRVIYEPKSHAVDSGVIQTATEGLQAIRERWSGRVVSDLEIYARMDGYNVLGGADALHLKPIGTTAKTSEPVAKAEMPKLPINGATLAESPVHGEEDYGKLASLLTRAELLMENGKYDVAEKELVGGQNQVNGNAQARVLYWTLLGDSRFRLDKPEEAYDCYQKAVKDDPSAERAWIGIGTYFLVKGELEQAQDIFSRVVNLNDTSMRGFLGLGNVMLRKGQASDALSQFIDANRIDPGYRPTIVGLVAAAVQAEEMDEALTPLRSYLDLHPEDSEARFHYAAILYGGNEVEQAREEAQRVLLVNPQHRGALELIDNLDQRTSTS